MMRVFILNDRRSGYCNEKSQDILMNIDRDFQ